MIQMQYFKMLWKAVGGKLIFLPTAVSTFLGLFGLPASWQPDNPLFWFVVVSPVVLWVIGGLLKLAVELQKKIDLDPTPDVSARFAFRHLAVDSKWALGLRPPIGVNENDPDNFYPEVEGTLRDSARNSRLRVWAREQPNILGKGGFKNTLEEVPVEEWNSRRFDLPSCVDIRLPTACLRKFGGKTLEDVQVNKQQVLQNWPRANLFEKWRDPTYKNRLEFFNQESHTKE